MSGASSGKRDVSTLTRLEDELGKVDDRVEPRVLLSDQVGVFLDVEDGSKRQGRLVELLTEVNVADTTLSVASSRIQTQPCVKLTWGARICQSSIGQSHCRDR